MIRLVPLTSSFSLFPPAMNAPFFAASSRAASRTGFERTTYSPSFAMTKGRASIGAASKPPRSLERTMRSLALGVNSVGPTCMRISPLVSFRDQRNDRRGTGIFWRTSVVDTGLPSEMSERHGGERTETDGRRRRASRPRRGTRAGQLRARRPELGSEKPQWTFDLENTQQVLASTVGLPVRGARLAARPMPRARLAARSGVRRIGGLGWTRTTTILHPVSRAPRSENLGVGGVFLGAAGSSVLTSPRAISTQPNHRGPTRKGLRVDSWDDRAGSATL